MAISSFEARVQGLIYRQRKKLPISQLPGHKSTLIVEEKKLTLVFQFGAQEPRYDHYLIFHVFPFDASL